MRRIAIAAMLAIPLLVGNAGQAFATDPPNGFVGCGGHCVGWFPFIHQHGPLYNYGPYYGYPPFEPYGYWNSYLQYTGPSNPYATGHGNMYGWIHAGHAQGHTWGTHVPQLLHKGKTSSTGCSSCAAAAAQQATSGDALERYNGVGKPASAAAYYADTPLPLTKPAGVVQTGLKLW